MKIGLLGAGHLGKIHLKCIQQIQELTLIGFYDPSDEISKQVEQEFGIPSFSSPESLMEQVEIVDIVSPTKSHYDLAMMALKRKKHLFIEKPITTTAAEALTLHELAERQNCKIQVGHVERFNPAFKKALELGNINPMFIEGHRLAQFNPRGTDVSVILDLMIHDLDLIISLVKSPVSSVQANGVAVVSDSPDICNARIEFKNGCVANLTASRISIKSMRKLRLFQPNAYVSLDLLEKELQVIHLHDQDPKTNNSLTMDTSKGKKWIDINFPTVEKNNAIKEELESFYQAVQQDTQPIVSAMDAYRSIELAQKISQEVELSLNKIRSFT